jgi:hypothetical protein
LNGVFHFLYDTIMMRKPQNIRTWFYRNYISFGGEVDFDTSYSYYVSFSQCSKLKFWDDDEPHLVASILYS